MSYLSRLERDLDRWIENGWIDPSSRADISEDARNRSLNWSASGALAILGATLLAMAALTFVAANWDAIPKLARLALVILTLCATLMAGGRALDRQQAALGHGLILVGSALFGAGILLTAQTFNMSAFSNTAFLIWALAAFLIALAIPSRPILILSIMLAAAWVSMETANPFMPDIMWPYPILWMVMLTAASRMKSMVSINLLALSIWGWLAHALWVQHDANRLTDMEWIGIGTLIAAALGMTAAFLNERKLTGMGVLTGWSGCFAVLGGFLLQGPLESFSAANIPTPAASPLYTSLATIALAVFAIALLARITTGRIARKTGLAYGVTLLAAAAIPVIAPAISEGTLLAFRMLIGAAIFTVAVTLILQGARQDQRFIGIVGLCAFILQTFYVYAETFGDLLDTALFFLIGGVILFALSALLVRLHKRTARQQEDTA